MKKILLIIFTLIVFTGCPSLNPIPTEANKGGLLGTVQNILSGNWSELKDDNTKKEKIKTDIKNESKTIDKEETSKALKNK